MIKVIMVLLMVGSPVAMIGENAKEKFDTVEACTKELPRLEKEAVDVFKKGKPPLKRGKDYEFKLTCVDTTPAADAKQKI